MTHSEFSERRITQCRLAVWLASLLFAFVFFRLNHPMAWQVAAFGVFSALLWPLVHGNYPTIAFRNRRIPENLPEEAMDAAAELAASRLPALVEVGLDLLAVTALVDVSGGFASAFSPLCFLVILEAFFLLESSSAIYTALVAALFNLLHFRLGVTSHSAVVYGVATGTLIASAILIGRQRGNRQEEPSLLFFGAKSGIHPKTRFTELLEQQLQDLETAHHQLRENYREVTQLHREQKNQLVQLRAAEQLFQASLESEEPLEGYSRLLRILMEIMDAGGGVLWLRPRGTEQFQAQAVEGRVAPNFDTEPIPGVQTQAAGELRGLCEARLSAAAPKSAPRPGSRKVVELSGEEAEEAASLAARAVAVVLLRDPRLDYGAPGSLLGAIGICDPRQPNRFTAADLDRLATLSAPFALALDNVEQRVQAVRRVREVSLLYDLSRLVQGATDMEQIYQAVVMQVQQVVPCENCTLFLLDAAHSRLEARATRGRVVNLLDHVAFDLGTGISGWVAGRGKPLIIGDLTEEPNLLNVEMIPPRIRSFIAIPLRVQDHIVGVINVSHSRPHAFTQDDIRLLHILAGQAAITIERTEVFHTLETLAITDGLTQIYNRRYFQMRLEEEICRSRRYDQPLSLLIIDADKFKGVNDHFGHASGDLVLQELARVLKQSVRETEIVARYGGEEFAIILPQTEETAALSAAERVRASVEKHRFYTVDGNPLRLTVSIGCADAPGSAQTAFALIEAADRALLKAKRGGRNRACSLTTSIRQETKGQEAVVA